MDALTMQLLAAQNAWRPGSPVLPPAVRKAGRIDC